MRSQFRPLGITGARICHNALAVRPHSIAKVSAPVITSRNAAVGPARSRRVREEEEEDDRPWELDGLTSMAHGELDQHREARHYARIAAYEMPLLSQLATPFVPPPRSRPLRFRYTTYMGEEHPAESKVVVAFKTSDLFLTVVERRKFVKLVGSRYNPQTKMVKMSCEMFEHQAQNKRYLSDLIDKLLAEARDPTDTFEDIPPDYRHHQFKPPNMKMPRSWLEVSKQRQEERARKRNSAATIPEEAVSIEEVAK